MIGKTKKRKEQKKEGRERGRKEVIGRKAITKEERKGKKEW